MAAKAAMGKRSSELVPCCRIVSGRQCSGVASCGAAGLRLGTGAQAPRLLGSEARGQAMQSSKGRATPWQPTAPRSRTGSTLARLGQARQLEPQGGRGDAGAPGAWRPLLAAARHRLLT